MMNRAGIVWLTKNKYTGDLSVTDAVFTDNGISEKTVYSKLEKQGIRPESIKKIYIVPYEPGKICWYVIAEQDGKRYYYCLDYYTGDFHVENALPTGN